MSTAKLDWRDLAPDPEMHSCGCELCPSDGELEPVRLPTLVVCDVGATEYVTDRFLLLPASLAPVPPGYLSRHPYRANAAKLIAQLSSITPEQPRGSHFPRSTLRALALTGWDLRWLSDQTATSHGVSRVAVVDQDGAPIGVAITASNPDRDDVDIYDPREKPA